MDERPAPPDSVPTYVREGVERQDAETLREIARWAERLAAWKERDVDGTAIREDLDEEEQVDEIDEDDRGTIVRKRVPCGKDCSGCPHGPYEYRVRRDGDTLKWEYLGKSSRE